MKCMSDLCLHKCQGYCENGYKEYKKDNLLLKAIKFIKGLFRK